MECIAQTVFHSYIEADDFPQILKKEVEIKNAI
jgi:hypothetical protein